VVEQIVFVVIAAFVLFALYRFRDFVFGKVLGGLVALVMRTSRQEDARAAVERKQREQIEEDFRTLSDTLLEFAVRRTAREFNYPYTEKLGIVRQMIGRLEQEAPALSAFLNPLSTYLDTFQDIDPKTARGLLDPVGRQLAELARQKK